MEITLLFLGTLLAGTSADAEAKRSIALIEKAKGTVMIDRKAPGQPIVGVNL